MAITTDEGKLSVMEWCSVWEPALPMTAAALDQAAQQHLLWGFTEILWPASVGPALAFVQDLNTRLLVYLRYLYSVTGGDLPTLVARYMAAATGDANRRMLTLIRDATAAMS